VSGNFCDVTSAHRPAAVGVVVVAATWCRSRWALVQLAAARGGGGAQRANETGNNVGFATAPIGAMTRRDRNVSATPRGVTAVEALGCPACAAVAVLDGWMERGEGRVCLDLSREVS